MGKIKGISPPLKEKKKYFNSKKGGENLQKLFNQAKEFTDFLAEERKVDQKLLHEPFTI